MTTQPTIDEVLKNSDYPHELVCDMLTYGSFIVREVEGRFVRVSYLEWSDMRMDPEGVKIYKR